MKFILFFAAQFAISGPSAEQPIGFEDKEKCEVVRKTILAKVEKHNASENPDKVVSMALVCVQTVKASQGLGV
jgi:hypothetical protein